MSGPIVERFSPEFAQPVPVRKGWILVKMAVVAGFAVVVNFFPHWIGVRISFTDPDSLVRTLPADFDSYLPWINLWLGLSFSALGVRLALGYWTAWMRWVEIGLRVFAVAILARVIFGIPVSANPFVNVLVKGLLVLVFLGAIRYIIQVIRTRGGAKIPLMVE